MNNLVECCIVEVDGGCFNFSFKIFTSCSKLNFSVFYGLDFRQVCFLV